MRLEDDFSQLMTKNEQLKINVKQLEAQNDKLTLEKEQCTSNVVHR